jgi:UDP-N-acetylglucosamine diphosphorylase/glucosamine-1-phosphate N-acetyltransferase
MQYVLFEDHSHFDLQPLTFTRPGYDLRVGIDTLREKWARNLGTAPATLAYDYLKGRFERLDPSCESLLINGKYVPDADLLRLILEGCPPGIYLRNANGEVLVARIPNIESLGEFDGIVTEALLSDAGLRPETFEAEQSKAIRFPWDIFQLNGACIRSDFEAITAGRKSAPINDKYTAVYGRDNIFLEPGVKIRANILNAEDGPIYLGEAADLGEGAIVHGTHAFCAHSTVSMGAKMRGDTTIGPWSKVGGEVGNSVIQAYSNKGHEGYMGNSVLGHWCNLGADTNTSNLKNNYTEIRIWNYPQGKFAKTGSIFCGLIMGDHSKCGINTMFNTGTVVGVGANIFGAGYPRNFIPSFSWGGSGGLMTYRLPKVFEVAKTVMARRKVEFEEEEGRILEAVFERTKSYRSWDNTVKKDIIT